jgi:hypothetical protein
MKRRIKQNAWGNWYGYEGSRKVKDFAESPYESQEQAAKSWLIGKDKDLSFGAFKIVLGLAK